MSRHSIAGFIHPSLLLALMLSLGVRDCLAQTDISLASLKWQHRIILIRAATSQSAALFKDELEKNAAGIVDRDIVWYVSHKEVLVHNHAAYGYNDASENLREALAARLSSDPSMHLLLIGKDGGVKVRADTLDLEHLFHTIDAMPMRMRELMEQ